MGKKSVGKVEEENEKYRFVLEHFPGAYFFVAHSRKNPPSLEEERERKKDR